jgi:hypothetical protein
VKLSDGPRRDGTEPLTLMSITLLSLLRRRPRL